MGAIDPDWETIRRQMSAHEPTEGRAPSRPPNGSSSSPATRPAAIQVKPGELEARTVKVTVVVATADVLALRLVGELSHITTTIRTADVALRTRLNAKSVGKAQRALRAAASPDTMVVVVQGRLASNGELAEAGLAVQVKKSPQPTGAE
jgi:hypothetical protein